MPEGYKAPKMHIPIEKPSLKPDPQIMHSRGLDRHQSEQSLKKASSRRSVRYHADAVTDKSSVRIAGKLDVGEGESPEQGWGQSPPDLAKELEDQEREKELSKAYSLLQQQQ